MNTAFLKCDSVNHNVLFVSVMQKISVYSLYLAEPVCQCRTQSIAKFNSDSGPKFASFRINIKIMSKSSENNITASDW